MNGKTQVALQPVLAPPVNSGLLQRQCACGQHTIAGSQCEECCKTGGEVPSIVHDVLNSPGEPLDPKSRAFMEPRFGGDFARVPVRLSTAPVRDLKLGAPGDLPELVAEAAADRAMAAAPSDISAADFAHVFIHRDGRAAQAARLVGARAFTVGSHIVFGAGEYQPGSFSGRRLLAHELAHVVQQTGPTIRRKVADGTAAAQPAASTSANERQPGDPNPDSNTKPEDLGKDDSKTPDAKAVPVAAQPKDSPADLQQKTVQAAAKDQDKPAEAQKQGDKAADAAQPAEPQSIGDLSTGDLALVDTELAEHQRWGAASQMVGAAGSADRAGFIAKKGADASSFGSSAVMGGAMAAGIKIAEKLLGKVVLKLAVKRLGASAVKFTPVPGVGAMIGGAIAGYELATRNWKETGETIGKFGKGASYYDTLANDIEAISTVLDVATQVLNVIAGIIGAISFGMWAVTIVTVGIASPLAFTLSAIAGAIGLVSLILDAINALVLKELVTTFRILDTFTSEADPREVVAEGSSISQSAGAATGFIGGLVGAHAVEAGSKRLGGEAKKPPAPPEHNTPPPGTGEGPVVKAEPPAEGAKPPGGTEPQTAEPPTQPAAKPVADAQTPAADVNAPVPEQTAKAPADAAPAAAAPKPEVKPAPAAAPKEPATAAPKEADAAPKKSAAAPKEAAPAEKPAKSKRPKKSGGGGGEPSGPEPQVSEIEQARLEEIEGKRQMAKGGGRVEDDFQAGSAEKKKPSVRRGDPKTPGRSEVSERVKADQRARGRKALGKRLQEVIKDPGKADPTTQKSLELLEGLETTDRRPKGVPKELWVPEQISVKEYIEKYGKLPPEIENHHLMGIADFPEFGHKPDVSVAAPKDIHLGAGHAYDTTRPLEAGTFLDPTAEEGGPRFNEDPEAQKGKRARTKERIAEGTAASTEKSGGIDRDLIIEREQRVKQLKAKQRMKPGPKVDAELKIAEAELKAVKDLVAKGSAPSQPVAAPQPGAPDQPGNVPEPAAAVDPGPPQEPAIDAPSPPLPPNEQLRVSTDDAAAGDVPPEGKLRVDTGDDAEAQRDAQAEQEMKEDEEATKQPLKAMQVPTLPPGPSGPSKQDEPESESWKNLKTNVQSIAAADPKKMSASERFVYGMTGPVTGALAVDAMRGAAKAHSEPIVRHVNPHYAPPPCTPEQITEVEKDILQTLEARADAERISGGMKAQEKHHQDNQKPITDMAKGTQDQITATEAHQQAVARRGEANDKKKEKEVKVQGTLDHYSEEAGKLAAIKVPMSGFKRFTGLAYSLPDDPGILLRVKTNLIKMNKDTTNFLNQLDQMDEAVATQNAGKGDRDKGIAADGQTLQDTGQKADESKDTFNQCKDTTEDLDKENQSKLDDATKMRSQADQTAGALAADAAQKKAKKESMAAALQTWAVNHRKARREALDQTKNNLVAQGYKVTEVKEL